MKETIAIIVLRESRPLKGVQNLEKRKICIIGARSDGDGLVFALKFRLLERVEAAVEPTFDIAENLI